MTTSPTTESRSGVKPWLTLDARSRSPRPEGRRACRPRVENDDYAAFTRRIVAAHGRRIAEGDIAGLTTLARLADDLDHAITTAITGLRAAGHSWADIGTALGITRQAAHQRWGHLS